MTPEAATTLIANALQAAFFVAGPLLLVALVAGVVVGLVQTVLQVNEQSISFVVKVIAVTAVLVVAGPALGAKMLDYTRGSLQSIAVVVK